MAEAAALDLQIEDTPRRNGVFDGLEGLRVLDLVFHTCMTGQADKAEEQKEKDQCMKIDEPSSRHHCILCVAYSLLHPFRDPPGTSSNRTLGLLMINYRRERIAISQT